ncbi:MAG: MoaD/ThiS family protein [Clostridiaceae bacterium]
MIRVKMLPPPGCDRSKIDERGWMQLPDGATLKDALKSVKCSGAIAKLLLASVNGERVPFSTELKDGDVVGFFMLCMGG